MAILRTQNLSLIRALAPCNTPSLSPKLTPRRCNFDAAVSWCLSSKPKTFGKPHQITVEQSALSRRKEFPESYANAPHHYRNMN
jgi:hypothetical protein